MLALKEDKKPEVRAAAAKTLGQLRPLNPKVREALGKALHDPDDTVRRAASDSLLDDARPGSELPSGGHRGKV